MDENKTGRITIVSNQWASVCQLPSYHRHVHSLFEELIHKTWGHGHWHPTLDVIETKDAFIIEIDLPGMDPAEIETIFDDASIEVQGQRPVSGQQKQSICLHVAERPVGKFYCAVDFPGPVDGSKASTNYINGVLTISVPKKPGNNL
jgi:HSP20 family protein